MNKPLVAIRNSLDGSKFPKLEKSYIGKSQQHVKTRIQEHIKDVWEMIRHGRIKNVEIMKTGGKDLEYTRE